MKSKAAVVVTLFLFAGATAFAQTITGGGTTGTIPKFTGATTIGDSQIRQIDDNIGVNTDYIVGRLSVFESRENGVNFSQPYAVYGNISSDMNFAAAVRGDASATTGEASGVIGVAYSPGGSGIVGLRTGSEGTGGAGIMGSTDSTTGFSFGARGVANGASGFSIGVFGEAFSPGGVAARFSNHGGGNIMDAYAGPYGSEKPVFRVDGRGTIFADGGFRPFGADFAESMAVTGEPSKYSAGDLLVIDPASSRHLTLAQQPYSTLVAGIHSTKPGLLGSTRRVSDAAATDEVPLAVVGIVPCKVTTENGAIQVGDLLVTSSTPGRAMKGTDRGRLVGAVVGKALEPLQQGTGMIQVLVTLQ
jgi:hypothetical protein